MVRAERRLPPEGTLRWVIFEGFLADKPRPVIFQEVLQDEQSKDPTKSRNKIRQQVGNAIKGLVDDGYFSEFDPEKVAAWRSEYVPRSTEFSKNPQYRDKLSERRGGSRRRVAPFLARQLLPEDIVNITGLTKHSVKSVRTRLRPSTDEATLQTSHPYIADRKAYQEQKAAERTREGRLALELVKRLYQNGVFTMDVSYWNRALEQARQDATFPEGSMYRLLLEARLAAENNAELLDLYSRLKVEVEQESIARERERILMEVFGGKLPEDEIDSAYTEGIITGVQDLVATGYDSLLRDFVTAYNATESRVVQAFEKQVRAIFEKMSIRVEGDRYRVISERVSQQAPFLPEQGIVFDEDSEEYQALKQALPPEEIPASHFDRDFLFDVMQRLRQIKDPSMRGSYHPETSVKVDPEVRDRNRDQVKKISKWVRNH